MNIDNVTVKLGDDLKKILHLRMIQQKSMWMNI